MPSFGTHSKSQYKTLHPKLQKICDKAIEYADFRIIEGVRSIKRQKELLAQGRTKTMNSKHLPDYYGRSRAMDIMICPIEWDNWQKNYLFAGFIKGIANSLGIKIVLGADWDGDFTTKDQSFNDIPHFNLDDDEV